MAGRKAKSQGGSGGSMSRRDVFRRIKAGTVAIATVPLDFGAAFQQAKTMLEPITIIGTGFIVDRRGVVPTAKHVVAPSLQAAELYAAGQGPMPATHVAVVFPGAGQATTVDPTTFDVKFPLSVALMIGANRLNDHDLAALLINVPPELGPLPELSLATDLCEEGDEVALCGFPFGKELHADQLKGAAVNASFSRGIVSATLPYPAAPAAIRSVFQIDAMINGGNSGGPVFNVQNGKVLGVAVSALSLNQAPPVGSTAGVPPALPVPTGLARCVHIHIADTLIREVRERIKNGTGFAPAQP